MKIGIISPDEGEWHTQKLAKALQRRGIPPKIFSPTFFKVKVFFKPKIFNLNDEFLDDFNALIVRRVPGGSLERVIFPPFFC